MNKAKQKNVLHVSMFGGISLIWNGNPLYLTKNVSSKMIHLFLLLLCAGQQGIRRDDLLEVLYGSNDLVQASNSFRAMVFRLRKALISAGLPEEDYITVKDGRYRWESKQVQVRLDVDAFQSAVTRGLEETEPARRQELLEEAEMLYQGGFLPMMIGEEWAAVLNNRYQKLYFTCMEELLALLKTEHNYEKILGYCDQILKWYPYEEWQVEKMDCLLALKDFSEAMKFYEEVVCYYQAEFGIAPPEEIQKRRGYIKDELNDTMCSIGEIKAQIMGQQEPGGATFCSYTVLAEIYRYMTWVLDRIGMSAFLMLLTITDKSRLPLEKAEVLEDTRNALQEAIGAAVRKSDAYARYGKNQFLVLLLGTNQEGCEVVERRIRANFQRLNTRKKVEVFCSVGSILDVNPDMIQRYYNQNSLNWR